MEWPYVARRKFTSALAFGHLFYKQLPSSYVCPQTSQTRRHRLVPLRDGPATVLAYFFPGFGATGGGMHAEYVINIGVFVVFFLHGVNLSSEQIKTA